MADELNLMREAYESEFPDAKGKWNAEANGYEDEIHTYALAGFRAAWNRRAAPSAEASAQHGSAAQAVGYVGAEDFEKYGDGRVNARMMWVYKEPRPDRIALFKAAPPVADAAGVKKWRERASAEREANELLKAEIAELRAALSRKAEQPAEAQGEGLTESLFPVIRAFGYTTSRQTAEIVEAIAAHLRAAGKGGAA